MNQIFPNLAGYFLHLVLGLLNLRPDLPHLPHQSPVIGFRLLPELRRRYLLSGSPHTSHLTPHTSHLTAYLEDIIIDQRYLSTE